ncbi:MAG: response regulator, partial [Pseudomonadota bacterium]
LISDRCSANEAARVHRRLIEENGVGPSRVVGFGAVAGRPAGAFRTVIDQPLTSSKLADIFTQMFDEARRRPPTGEPAPSAMRSGQVADVPEALLGSKVLIVDDVAANRKLVECILGQMGLTTVTAENGQQALEIACVEPFELILMDIYMPVMGGIEAVRELRKGDVNAATPVLALTASASFEERGEAFEAGMQGVLTKPININKLRARVVDVLTHPDLDQQSGVAEAS